MPEVAAITARLFPDKAITVAVRTNAPQDPGAALEQAVLAHPEFRRVIECLDANIERVIPLGEE